MKQGCWYHDPLALVIVRGDGASIATISLAIVRGNGATSPRLPGGCQREWGEYRLDLTGDSRRKYGEHCFMCEWIHVWVDLDCDRVM